ncbi:MAG TPA: GNAT family N-acetyltransferase [Anaeromyxobacter sp.]
MTERQIRPLRPDDFSELMRLEEEVFARSGESVLGAYYVRLCCEFFPETCFIAVEGGRAVGYVLSFVRGAEAYCTTLAVAPELQGTRVAIQLLRALVRALASQVDSVWFTVKEDNAPARALHRALGAREVEVREDFYGPGDRRLVSRIERPVFERLRGKLERLGIVDASVPSAAAPRPLAGVA